MKTLLISLLTTAAAVAVAFALPLLSTADRSLLIAYVTCACLVFASWVFGMILDRIDYSEPRIE
jgi:hypothetical protein